MISIPAVNDYIAYIRDHKSWINRLRLLLIDNIVLPTLRRDDIYFDAETFDKCVRYVEGNYYPLFPYQKFIYAMAFLYLKDSDEPVFKTIIVIMGRGNGKDGFMAPLANFLQTPLYGQKGYHIEIVSNEERQSKDTFDVVYDMLTENDRVKPKFKGKFTATKEQIKNLATKSILRYNTSNPKTKDGKKIGCLILNEIHAYENSDQINVFESAFGKVPRRREFIITTAGYVREGPYDKNKEICTEILETGENPLQYLPFICELDSEAEVDNPDAWHKANPSLEFMPILQSEIQLAYLKMQKDQTLRPEFLTKRCNLVATRVTERAVTSWLNILRCSFVGTTMEELERREARFVPDRRGRSAIVGIDYADIRDFASAGILTQKEGIYVWEQKTWVNRQSEFFDSIKFPLASAGLPGFQDYEVIDEPVIPVDKIVAHVLSYMEEYDVRKIAMDTYRYSLFKIAFERAGITIESRQDPHGTVRLIRKIGSATGVIAPFIEQEFELGHIIFGDSAIMRWFTNNTCTVMDKYGNKQFVKIEPKLRKNDGFMAFDAAMFCKDELEETIMYV